MSDRLVWERDGQDWPLREASRFVEAGGWRWHVQDLGTGPVALLIHGTGSSTHTWRDVAPALAERFRVVMVDLPGHAFTQRLAHPVEQKRERDDRSLPGMAASLGALVAALGLDVALAVGHSAGAAILLRMALDGSVALPLVISFNGALLPLGGLPGLLFPPVARLMGSSVLIPRLFSRRAGDPGAVERLISGTGSTLDERGIALYRRLVSSPQHAAAALAMMANWDLRPLARDLPRLSCRLELVAAMNDSTVPPRQAEQVLRRIGARPQVRLTRLPGLGHLAHEERPLAAARLIEASHAEAAPAAPSPMPAPQAGSATFSVAAATRQPPSAHCSRLYRQAD